MKRIHLENDKRERIPSYELTCPFCGNKIHVEETLSEFCNAIYCHYCSQKIESSKLE